MNQESWPGLVRYWLPPLLWAAVIFGLSSVHHMPNTQDSLPGIPVDKIGHFIVYGVLGVLLYRGFALGEGFSLRFAVGLAVLFSTAYGLSDEVHQAFVPGREFQVMDMVADFLGAGVAVGIYAAVLGKR